MLRPLRYCDLGFGRDMPKGDDLSYRVDLWHLADVTDDADKDRFTHSAQSPETLYSL